MIECHPLLRPIVNLAKPVVHAAKTWHPKIVGVHHHVRHHVHRAFNAATPSQTVMTVCQRVAGPILAGGLVLLPPASAPPPAGGVGGFPGAIVPEYGAPAFGPGYPSAGSPYAYAPGTSYGPAALGLGGVLAPTVLASNTPQITAPGTSTPAPTLTVPTTAQPGTTTPTSPTTTQPGTTTPTSPTTTQPGTTTPPPSNTTPPGNTPPSTTPPTDTSPGGSTPPVNTPEPASIAVLAGAFALAIFSRALWTRRTHRD